MRQTNGHPDGLPIQSSEVKEVAVFKTGIQNPKILGLIPRSDIPVFAARITNGDEEDEIVYTVTDLEEFSVGLKIICNGEVIYDLRSSEEHLLEGEKVLSNSEFMNIFDAFYNEDVLDQESGAVDIEEENGHVYQSNEILGTSFSD